MHESGIIKLLRLATAASIFAAIALLTLLTLQPATGHADASGTGDEYSGGGTAAPQPDVSGSTVPATETDVSKQAPGAASKTLNANENQATASTAVPASAPDTTPPLVTNLHPADSAITGPLPTIGYDYQDDSSGVVWPDGVHLFIDDRCSRAMPGQTDISASRLTYTPSAPLREGHHTIEGFLIDYAGNYKSTFWSITVDATGPRVTGSSPTGTLNTTGTVLHAAYNDGSGAGVNASGILVSLDGKDISGDCSKTDAELDCAMSALSDDIHQVGISVPDLVGNYTNHAWSFRVDTASVGVTGQHPLPGSWQTGNRPLIAADFQQAPTGAIDTGTVSVLVDGADVSSQLATSTGGFSYTPAADLEDGVHTVQVNVRDDAGHSGFSQWSFSVDTVAPAIGNQSPTGASGNSKPTISAGFNDSMSGIDSASLRLSLDGEDITAAATIDQYTISFTPHDALAPGLHSVQLDVTDTAGNSSTEVWSFSYTAPVLSPPAEDQRGPAGATPQRAAGSTYVYDYVSMVISPGRWMLTGFTVQPNSYFFPWYELLEGSGRKTEIQIRNRGAGEAYVNIFLAGGEKWSGKIAEGGQETASLPGASGGPVQIICPTGQPLETEMRFSGEGWESAVKALPGDRLETTYVLPWYEGRTPGVDNRLAIANAGTGAAEVDVFIGDSLLDESRKSHFTIQPGTAALADFPGVSGGIVKVVCTNNQPLAVSQLSRYKGSISQEIAASLINLGTNYTLETQPLDDGSRQWLLVGNPNGMEISFRISQYGEAVGDLDNGGNDEFTLQPEQARVIELDPADGGTVEVSCDRCGFGRGMLVARRVQSQNMFSEMLAGTDSG